MKIGQKKMVKIKAISLGAHVADKIEDKIRMPKVCDKLKRG